MILVGSISHAHIFFIVPAVPGYQTAVCVCECTIRRWVFGWWYNQAIERQKACGGRKQRRPLLLQMCVRATVCVCVCVLGAVDYANVVTVKERGGCFGVTDSHCCCLLCWSMKTSGRSCSSEL